VFGISPNGSLLPVGMTLTAAGILAIGAALTSDVSGVIFTYSVPGT
jgi:hypothetical protein